METAGIISTIVAMGTTMLFCYLLGYYYAKHKVLHLYYSAFLLLSLFTLLTRHAT